MHFECEPHSSHQDAVDSCATGGPACQSVGCNPQDALQSMPETNLVTSDADHAANASQDSHDHDETPIDGHSHDCDEHACSYVGTAPTVSDFGQDSLFVDFVGTSDCGNSDIACHRSLQESRNHSLSHAASAAQFCAHLQSWQI